MNDVDQDQFQEILDKPENQMYFGQLELAMSHFLRVYQQFSLFSNKFNKKAEHKKKRSEYLEQKYGNDNGNTGQDSNSSKTSPEKPELTEKNSEMKPEEPEKTSPEKLKKSKKTPPKKQEEPEKTAPEKL